MPNGPWLLAPEAAAAPGTTPPAQRWLYTISAGGRLCHRRGGLADDSERHGDIADLLVCRCEERLGTWPVDLSGGSGLPAAGDGYPARQLVVDREDRGDLEMRHGYRDEGFPVCGFN